MSQFASIILLFKFFRLISLPYHLILYTKFLKLQTVPHVIPQKHWKKSQESVFFPFFPRRVHLGMLHCVKRGQSSWCPPNVLDFMSHQLQLGRPMFRDYGSFNPQYLEDFTLVILNIKSSGLPFYIIILQSPFNLIYMIKMLHFIRMLSFSVFQFTSPDKISFMQTQMQNNTVFPHI